MSWNLSQISRRAFRAALIPYSSGGNWSVKRESAVNTRLLPPAKMLLVPMNFLSYG